jgi:hypothetical protein
MPDSCSADDEVGRPLHQRRQQELAERHGEEEEASGNSTRARPPAQHRRHGQPHQCDEGKLRRALTTTRSPAARSAATTAIGTSQQRRRRGVSGPGGHASPHQPQRDGRHQEGVREGLGGARCPPSPSRCRGTAARCQLHHDEGRQRRPPAAMGRSGGGLMALMRSVSSGALLQLAPAPGGACRQAVRGAPAGRPSCRSSTHCRPAAADLGGAGRVASSSASTRAANRRRSEAAAGRGRAGVDGLGAVRAATTGPRHGHGLEHLVLDAARQPQRRDDHAGVLQVGPTSGTVPVTSTCRAGQRRTAAWGCGRRCGSAPAARRWRSAAASSWANQVTASTLGQ